MESETTNSSRETEDTQIAYYRINDACINCGNCLEACYVEAIEKGRTHYIITDECIACGVCSEVCPKSAIVENF
ncbi:4Fe-4S dicluster domain-containing protein [Heliobacillus mobilis]|uniref:Ferredoxin n=1 Tax=Heliobacterium mobile TaxID=28064 RepID=A0A6I3SLH4_HELMO|nr:4Fe-4S binding protein [Heliobacterium mobile]MTV49774.1 4Fe-4S dicluster domain-containing protein [Heliobacterium mobile]